MQGWPRKGQWAARCCSRFDRWVQRVTPEETSEIELPCIVADTAASWRRIFANRNGADPRDLLQKASADLWETIEINRTVHPESHVVARQETVDALQEMAESSVITQDDDQLIFKK